MNEMQIVLTIEPTPSDRIYYYQEMVDICQRAADAALGIAKLGKVKSARTEAQRKTPLTEKEREEVTFARHIYGPDLTDAQISNIVHGREKDDNGEFTAPAMGATPQDGSREAIVKRHVDALDVALNVANGLIRELAAMDVRIETNAMVGHYNGRQPVPEYSFLAMSVVK